MADEKSFGELLIEGLEEAVAYNRGELQDVTVRRVARTARETEIAPPPRYDAEAIARIRKDLNVSQPVFASMLNVSRSTVRAWEQGAREPEGPTRRLLEVAEQHPETLAKGASFSDTRVREGGKKTWSGAKQKGK